MESTRRSFDRSREQGPKKPRLEEGLNSQNFPQRPIASGVNLLSSRFRNDDRDLESNDSGGEAYHPQHLQLQQQQQYHELVRQYRTALAELTVNSKPIITNLTIIAGENKHVAKGIVATICSNIVEVPSDQKLPSLYLLDSIVKNIGRDYIKYFAARLSEVFCKVYRQVDAPIQSSMRHLFGTWKGVFPPQTLQVIDKELVFASAANGLSSRVPTSKSDSQSQRPPNSIHINPKYLERQGVQQSNQTIQRKDSINDRVDQKNISTPVGGFEYGTDLSRYSGLGVGRTSGKVIGEVTNKPWYNTGSNVSEKKNSGQKNGFNVKNGYANYQTSKSSNVDILRRQNQSITGRNGSGISSSWKNTEEEEFMWDDLNSRQKDLGVGAADVSSNSRKNNWASDDSDRLEYENHIGKPGSQRDAASGFVRENSADSHSSEQKEQTIIEHQMPSSWSLQESNSADEPLYAMTSMVDAGHSEGYLSAISRFPTSAGSLTKRSYKPNDPRARSLPQSDLKGSQITEQLSNRYHSQSAQDSLKIPRCNFDRSNLQKSPSKGLKGQSPSVHSFQPRQHNHSLRQLQEDLTDPESTIQAQKSPVSLVSDIETVPVREISVQGHSNHLAAETPVSPDTSSLLAAFMNSGILSNPSISGGLLNLGFQDLGQKPSQSGVKLPVPGGPPQFTSSVSHVASSSLLVHPSHDKKSSPRNISLAEKEPSLPPGLPASSLANTASPQTSNNESTPISNLLSSLVAKGLISESKKKLPDLMPSQRPAQSQNKSPGITSNRSVPISSITASSCMPLSSAVDEVPLSKSAWSQKQRPGINTISPLPTSSPFSSNMHISSSMDEVPLSRPASSRKQSPGIGTDNPVLASSYPVSSTVPISSAMDKVPPSKPAGTSASSPKSLPFKIKNLIGLEFKTDIIRELHPSVINGFYDEIPCQCKTCGLRFKFQEQLDRHLGWHALKVSKPREFGSLRRWFSSSDDWIERNRGFPFEVKSTWSLEDPSKIMQGETLLPADESQCACALCGETFEDVYSKEKDEWMFGGATYMTIPYGKGDVGNLTESAAQGLLVHANCISESLVHDLGLVYGIKMEKDAEL